MARTPFCSQGRVEEVPVWNYLARYFTGEEAGGRSRRQVRVLGAIVVSDWIDLQSA